jgi:hypothetical protein
MNSKMNPGIQEVKKLPPVFHNFFIFSVWPYFLKKIIHEKWEWYYQAQHLHWSITLTFLTGDILFLRDKFS